MAESDTSSEFSPFIMSGHLSSCKKKAVYIDEVEGGMSLLVLELGLTERVLFESVRIPEPVTN